MTHVSHMHVIVGITTNIAKTTHTVKEVIRVSTRRDRYQILKSITKLLCILQYKQSDWLKKVITIIIISLHIHDKRSLTCDP
jgi:hypothetical protein